MTCIGIKHHLPNICSTYHTDDTDRDQMVSDGFYALGHDAPRYPVPAPCWGSRITYSEAMLCYIMLINMFPYHGATHADLDFKYIGIWGTD